MKTRKTILSVFALLMGLVFLTGTTGITLILHSCASCGDSSVMSGIFLAPEEPEADCCKGADTHCSADIADRANTFKSTCCNFRIEKIKFSNYTPSLKFSVSPITDILRVDFTIDKCSPANIAKRNISIHNKHGGRSIITYNCQYLA